MTGPGKGPGDISSGLYSKAVSTSEMHSRWFLLQEKNVCICLCWMQKRKWIFVQQKFIFFYFFLLFFFWRHFSSNKALFPKIETHPRKCSQLWTKITRSWWQNDVLNLGCQHSGPMRDLQTQNFKSRLQSKISRFQLFAPKCHMPGLCWVGLVVFFGWI